MRHRRTFRAGSWLCRVRARQRPDRYDLPDRQERHHPPRDHDAGARRLDVPRTVGDISPLHPRTQLEEGGGRLTRSPASRGVAQGKPTRPPRSSTEERPAEITVAPAGFQKGGLDKVSAEMQALDLL